MSQVRVLPPEVIAKIAAGEVVERPASVVKELLENAIDAKATAIEIRLKEAGKQLIHIRDNGQGIEPDDLDIIFLRHATSKIQTQDDLFLLSSLGFRGEALYSIAAVADVQLKSCHQDYDEGWEVHYRDGVCLNKKPAATTSHGTDIKVTEIFYNTPARKKFLKSNISEMNAILAVVLPYAMLYPQIRFLLVNNDKTMIDVLPTSSSAERFAQLLNLKADHLIEESYEYQDDNIRIRLLLGNINIQRKKRDLQYLFVNNRPVTHRNLEFQVNDIYRLIFPPQTYSAFAVMIDVPTEDVDANIHPTKREVKIKDEYRLISKLRRLTEQALMTKGSMKTVEEKPYHFSAGSYSQSANQPSSSWDQTTIETSLIQESLPTYKSEPQVDIHRDESHPELFQKKTSEPLHDRLKRSRYIGQFIRKFLLFEVDDSLLLIDQHAAQERIMFERFRKQMEESRVEVQALLSPIVMPLSPQEKIAMEEVEGVLSQAGFDTTFFDENTMVIQSHPLLIKNPEKAVRSVLAGKPHERCEYDVIARRACKASIVTGDKISPEQALHQRDELLLCQDPFTCPHGRPTLIDVKESFLDKQFLRT